VAEFGMVGQTRNPLALGGTALLGGRPEDAVKSR